MLPAALGLRRAGASRGATVSFLIATPETGPDSIAISWGLLGPFMAVLRPVAAVLSAIAAGLLTSWTDARDTDEQRGSDPSAAPVTGCCSSADSCGDAAQPAAESNGTSDTPESALAGLRYAFTAILDDIAPWLAVGLVLAAIVATWVPPMVMAEWGSGLLPMLGMLALGIPMYICATASTPLAAALLLAGLSPGTVLVFLLAGPATNIATMGIVRREMGNRTLATYLGGICVSAVVLGLLTDVLVEALSIDVTAQLGSRGELVPVWFAALCGAVLLVFALRRLLPSAMIRGSGRFARK